MTHYKLAIDKKIQGSGRILDVFDINWTVFGGRLRSRQIKKALQDIILQDFKKNEGAGTRTQDPRLKRPLLYQLSYTLSLGPKWPCMYNLCFSCRYYETKEKRKYIIFRSKFKK
jgi:hypothetical protein